MTGRRDTFATRSIDPLVLGHSWPLTEKAGRLDLGRLLSCAITDALEPAQVGHVDFQHAGCWECDLADQSLTWSGGVYDIFGLPRGVPVKREEAVAFYSERSRAAMEKLRSYAIGLRRGFTIDAEISPAVGGQRWMRLVGVPVCEGKRVARLHGIKLIL